MLRILVWLLVLGPSGASAHGLEWTGGEQDGEAVAITWTSSAPVPIHVWSLTFETDAAGLVEGLVERQQVVRPGAELTLWSKRDGVPPFTQRICVFAALSEGQIESVRRALRAVKLPSGQRVDLRRHALGKDLAALDAQLGLRDLFDNATPRFQSVSASAGPDPWGLYRKVGRAWTHARSRDGRVVHERRVVTSVEAGVCSLQVSYRSGGEPALDRTEEESILLPGSLPGPPPTPAALETITVKAGTFRCFKLVTPQATTWSSAELTGLVVKSVSPAEQLELVELVR